MGKKQHQKDKLYLTTTEWSTLYGGKKKKSEKTDFKRLPYFCCSLSMQPFEHPYCTEEGVIFDLLSIVPFLKKFGINPVTGKKMVAKDLVKLTFHKNAQDKYHCPVTFRVFNENTHIVAVKPTGNVFCYEAVERLNIKTRFWKDLLTDQDFTRKDLITIQDPTNLEKFNLSHFFHIRKNIKLTDEEDEAAKKDPRYHLKAVNAETQDILEELSTSYKPEEQAKVEKKKADAINAAHYSTGRVAASFTSTVMGTETTQEAAIIDEDILRYARIKKKGYVSMITSLGPLNFELHSEMVPRACENFLKHCHNGYYKGTVFHRSIKNFMIQGGDPDGTGRGGQSIWGKEFKDELKPNLSHTGRGILSMANTGPNTNKSQFFITFRSAKHLDGKHTVFGKVVGGLETLDKMEKIEVDAKDRPKDDIIIQDCQVYVNPYDEVEQMLETEREEALEKAREAAKSKIIPQRATEDKPRVFKKGVGKYINMATQKRTIAEEQESETVKKKRNKPSASFTNFKGW